jgi:hypothetical protein
MPIRIRCRDKPLDRQQAIEYKGVKRLRQEIPRRVIRPGNQSSASYADRSNYCYLPYDDSNKKFFGGGRP